MNAFVDQKEFFTAQSITPFLAIEGQYGFFDEFEFRLCHCASSFLYGLRSFLSLLFCLGRVVLKPAL